MRKSIFIGLLLFITIGASDLPINSSSHLYAIDYNGFLYHTRADIHDSTTTYKNSALTDDLIKQRINIIQRQVCAYTNAISSRVLLSPTTNQQEYDLASDYVDMKRVAYINQAASTDSYRRLEFRTLDQLDQEFPGWEDDNSGLPTRYYIRDNKLGLYPKPSGSYSQADALKYDYYKRPVNMVNATDTPYNDMPQLQEFDHVILNGTVAWCRRTLGLDDSRFQRMYERWLDIMKEKLKLLDDAGGIIETEKDYDSGGYR